MLLRTFSASIAALFFAGLFHASAADDGVKITQLDGKLSIEIGGKPFTDYHYEGAPHLYFYPVLGPGGLPMTRSFPMKDVPGEEQDHKHHRSLWYSHGSVNGVDFWSEEKRAGKIVHDKFLQIDSGADSGVIRSANKWIAPDGTVVCTDERTVRIYNRPANERLFDFEIILKAGDKEVVFGDTKEGSMAMRVNESMRVVRSKKTAAGHIINSNGVEDSKTWGKRADWCDYYGRVEGKTVGVAIFDHPSNPRHPTWWHVRDYGLFGANPFGIHDFEKKPPGTGDLTLPAHQTLTFRYRFYMHEGDEKQAKVAEHYDEYAQTK